MGYHFRPAIKSEAKPLIGLYAESGCGKTYSALLLARGFTGDMGKVGMVETESGRGEIFADDPLVGGYLVVPIRDNFAPKEYGSAISAAGQANLQVLIIDSASHEWEGAGGVLSMAAQNQESGKKGPLVWQMPKLQHQREFMLKLLTTPVPLVIVCMRAKFPMKEVVKNGKKEWSRSETLEPKQADDILFEMTVHAWIDQQHNLHVTKCSKDDLKTVFLDNQPITIETGQRLAEWSKGIAKPLVSPATDERKQYLKSIQDSLVKVWPGKSAADTKAKVGMIARAFNGASWKDLEVMSPIALSVAAERFKRFAEEIEGGSFESLTEEVAIQAWAKVVMTEEQTE